LQIQSADALDHLGIGFARHPAELVGAAVGERDAGVVFRDAGNQADGIGEIGSFGGDDKGRVHLNRHRQFPPRTIIDNATLGREVEAALLLVLGAALKVAIAENLEVDQPQADGQQPQTQESRQGEEPEFRAV